jgi:hypothetical protein
MGRKIEIELDEALRVFRLLEEVNDFFHQPMKYEDKDYSSMFAGKNYPEIHKLYYDIIWEWFPGDIKEQMRED